MFPLPSHHYARVPTLARGRSFCPTVVGPPITLHKSSSRFAQFPRPLFFPTYGQSDELRERLRRNISSCSLLLSCVTISHLYLTCNTHPICDRFALASLFGCFEFHSLSHQALFNTPALHKHMTHSHSHVITHACTRTNTYFPPSTRLSQTAFFGFHSRKGL